MTKKQENILIIHNVRSVQNVGAMFRTADAAGIDKIYLTGYTPTPLDRFGRKRGDLAKSALGAEEFVSWEQKKSILPLLAKLKKDKFTVIAVEQDKNSVDYKTLRLRSGQGNVFIVGAEVTGIPKNILEKCDIIAEIPMLGKKESLNVSVACGIALFGILGR
ncbi:TrmH family RNA methyltransferase [Candidatus Nomurabacteria bacterium]|nr:TrmH family RNA methyltransferase [Candidatus Nomurabacteria bacterium]